MSEIEDLVECLRAERPLLGQLAAEMRFKQSIVERVGVEAAFALTAAELAVPRIDALHRRRIRPLIDVARTEGLAYRELWPGGTHQTLKLPRVVGQGNHGEITIVERAAFLACIDDVTLRGRSNVLLRGDEALLDFEGNEYAPSRDSPEYDPMILKATTDEAWTMGPLGDVPRVPQALNLCATYAGDFGHWLLEYLPKIAMARLTGWPGGMPVLVDKGIPVTIRNALPRLLPPDSPLILVPYLAPMQVDRLWCLPNPNYAGFYPSDSMSLDEATHIMSLPRQLAMLQREVFAITAAATAESTGIERIYLDRRSYRKKSLVNQEAIKAVLERHAFTCVYPEDLDLFEQLRLVRHARFIVAPEGSNSLLYLLARPGAKVCVLSSPNTHLLGDVCATADELGVEVTLLTGPYASDRSACTEQEFWSFWNDYAIDAAGFERFLGPWLACQAP